MGLLDGILGFLGGAGDIIGQVLSFVLNIIVQVAQVIWSVLQVIVSYVITVFKGIGSFFLHIWDGFFKNIFIKTFNALRSLSQWLESHLRPLIDFLKKAQALFDKLYLKYIKPILLFIQRIRQFLTILRALHIQWAADLDAALGKVQSDINAVFLKIHGTINAMIDVLNIVTDPTRLLRHPMLILSMRRSIYALIRQLTGLPPGMFFASSNPNAPVGLKAPGKNFNPADPSQNPPPSYYMSLSSPVPSLSGWGSGIELPDDYADDVPAMDFFATAFDVTPDCSDGLLCFMQVTQDSMQRSTNG